MAPKLKAPYPYFGGKSRVAALVWSHLGDVDNYIEPFAGSAACLLARPHPPRIETVNDADCYVANFWRATGRDPEAVVEYADGPVNEADLHARHRWLVLSDEAKAFRERMRRDPDYFDAKVAGWWCWGLCCWIGGGWCTQNDETGEGKAFSRGENQMPCKPDSVRGVHGKGGPPGGTGNRAVKLGGGPGQHGNGLHAKRPAISCDRGVNGNDSASACEQRRAWLLDWFNRLRDRLRTVRVCCGNWLRVCDSESVTTKLGTTGIFFDPPYSTEAGRDMNLYGVDSGTVAHDVRAYCLERGGDPKMRLVLAGYEGEGHEELEAVGWSVIAWKAQGGYGNRSEGGKDNAKKERLWISPHCNRERSLFDE